MDEEYEPTDSEDDYSKEDKLLLNEARRSMRGKDISSEEEVYGFDESDSNEDFEGDEDHEEEEENDVDMGSDIEDEKRPPDERAWGKRAKNFYSTDFVDQDYEGIYQGEEAERAELEEEEARNIQKRLIEQLNDADFSIHEAVDIAEATEATLKKEIIESDLSKLTKRQKLDLVKKESPEFFVLIEDFKEKVQEAQKFMPVISYFQTKVKTSFPALDYLKTKLSIILNYCTNISYYLYLKAKRIPIKNHPVLKSMFRYRQLLLQMEEVDNKVMKPQIDEIIETVKAGKEITLDDNIVKMKTLKLLSKRNKKQIKKVEETDEVVENGHNDVDMEDEGDEDIVKENEEEKVEESQKEGKDKRAITYEMAKNKGLTPKRSKEQRNPRVKHRKKFEKAKIRRRGQVRTPRQEIPVYGGEPTGIKVDLSKSIKFKY